MSRPRRSRSRRRRSPRAWGGWFKRKKTPSDKSTSRWFKKKKKKISRTKTISKQPSAAEVNVLQSPNVTQYTLAKLTPPHIKRNEPLPQYGDFQYETYNPFGKGSSKDLLTFENFGQK
jgi:hypothetical protein